MLIKKTFKNSSFNGMDNCRCISKTGLNADSSEKGRSLADCFVLIYLKIMIYRKDQIENYIYRTKQEV